MNVNTRCAALGAVVGACAILAACASDSSTGPKATDLSGHWTISTTISNSKLGIKCTASGDVAMSQTGSQFTGQVTGSSETCTGPGGSASASVDGSMTGGEISGSTATYSGGECSYTGTIGGTPANRVSGTVTCQVPVKGTNYVFGGTFVISR